MFIVAVKKIEHSLLRMYLVNASANSKLDKVLEFFEKMGPELNNQPEWKDWFGKSLQNHFARDPFF